MSDKRIWGKESSPCAPQHPTFLSHTSEIVFSCNWYLTLVTFQMLPIKFEMVESNWMLLTSTYFMLPAERCLAGCSVTRTAVGVFVSREALDSPRNSTSGAILMAATGLSFYPTTCNEQPIILAMWAISLLIAVTVSPLSPFQKFSGTFHYLFNLSAVSVYEYIFSVSVLYFLWTITTT